MAKEEYEYAGVLARFLALLIDAIILAIVLVPMMLLAGVFGVSGAIASKNPMAFWGVFWVVWGIGIVVQFLYFTILEGLRGQTIGKMAMNIKVVGYHGKEIGMAKAFIRNLLRIIDGLFAYIIGLIFIVATEKKQRLGDIAAGSVVISLRESSKFVPEKPKA